MTIFQDNLSWLKCRVNKILQLNHFELVHETLPERIKRQLNILFSRNGWWKITLIVISIFFTCTLIPVKTILHLTFNTDGKSISTLIDQRTANLATIIGMVLTVTGFVISNMAIKESYAYHVLFKKSKLYGIIYFVLSTIVLLIFVSSLRDTFVAGIYERMVLAGSIMVILIILLIAFLFRAIINFTNPKVIDQIYREDLLTEEKAHLATALAKKYAYESFRFLMQNMKATEYTLSIAFEENLQDYTVTEIGENDLPFLPADSIIDDIDMNGLYHFMYSKKGLGQIYFRDLRYGETTVEKDDYIWVKGIKNSDADKNILKKCLMLRKVSKMPSSQEQNARKYFDEKLGERSDDGKAKGLDEILAGYLDVYLLEMKNHKA